MFALPTGTYSDGLLRRFAFATLTALLLLGLAAPVVAAPAVPTESAELPPPPPPPPPPTPDF